ncbi:MAG: L,D-transpeptidase family protein [Methylovirgula sp.]
MFSTTDLASRIGAFAAAVLVAAVLAGCSEEPGHLLTSRASEPLSPQMLALMQEKGTTPAAPMLIRTYKKEAEFEIWKMRSDGRYALLKTYPMCRWSGQLGPKTHEGDRQVPEGFYKITPAQMNPNSNYYLSFNVGYPNAYDRAHGATGESIMVHGACSSAGCFSMTDDQIAEIYAVAREAFAGGQREIQMQSLPFHMTAENLAKYRLDPNIAFWKELKTGSDNFEVTRQEVAVGVCGDHYVFNAEAANGGSLEPTLPCPPLKHDPMVEAEVLAKQKRDDAKIAELIAAGVRPVYTVYADGGQNPSFASWHGDVSRPAALAEGSVDVAINAKHKTPTLKQLKAAEAKDLAEAKAEEKKATALREERTASEDADTPQTSNAQPQSAVAPASLAQQPNASDNSVLHHLFGMQQPRTQAVAQPQQPAAEPMTDNSAFYEQTQPQPERSEQDATNAASASTAGSDAAAPIPPLRRQAQTPDAAQEASDAAATQPDAASSPAQQTQATAQPGNPFSGAASFFKQGFSALTTPSQ